MLFLFLYNMSKGKETMVAEIAATIKKKGFILYKKDLNLCCAHFDDTAIGRIMRHINEYVKNPSYSPQKIEFAEQLQYDLFVDGIRENTEEWRDKIVQRRLRYEESKKNNSDNSDKTNNSDNSDKTNNSDNCDKTDNSDKTNETGIDKKNTSEDNTVQSNQVQSNQVQSNQVQSNQVQSNQATSNDVSSTQINSKSKKEYQTSFFDLFSNKEYTKNYLNEKKIYFKSDEAFERFFNFNLNDCHWCYRAETAAGRWFKNNPEDKGQPPIPKKEAPQPPTTPAKLKEKREQIWDAIRDQIPFTDFKSWFAPLQLLAIQETIDGDNVQLGFKDKFHGEYFGEKFSKIFRQTYFALTSHNVNKIEGCFVDTFRKELLWFQFLTNEEAKQKQKEAIEKAEAEKAEAEAQAKKNKEARERVMANLLHNKKPIPNVYADAPQKLTTETTTPPDLKTLHAEILEQCKQNVTKVNYNLYYETIELLAVDYYDNNKIDGTRYAELTIGVINQNFIDLFRKDFEKNYATAFKIIKAYEPHIFYKIITPEKY